MISPENDAGCGQAEAEGAEAETPGERTSYDLLSMVNHELRTPLTAIQGALGLLAGGMGGELPEKARSLVEIAARNSERLARLISDLLELAILPPAGPNGEAPTARRLEQVDQPVVKK